MSRFSLIGTLMEELILCLQSAILCRLFQAEKCFDYSAESMDAKGKIYDWAYFLIARVFHLPNFNVIFW